MNNKPISTIHCFSFLLVSLLLSQLAFAEQYDQGNERHQKHVNSNREEIKNYNSDRRENHNRRSGYSHDDPGVSVGVYFGDRHRTYTHDYYQEEFQSGHCPPGLAKKHNGCVSPGQERRWLPAQISHRPGNEAAYSLSIRQVFAECRYQELPK